MKENGTDSFPALQALISPPHCEISKEQCLLGTKIKKPACRECCKASTVILSCHLKEPARRTQNSKRAVRSTYRAASFQMPPLGQPGWPSPQLATHDSLRLAEMGKGVLTNSQTAEAGHALRVTSQSCGRCPVSQRLRLLLGLLLGLP